MVHSTSGRGKIDTSYNERRRINRLLDFMTRERLTREQLERIGLRLQKSGRRALPPLVRRLWRTENQEHLYRYASLLDFFEADTWLDQLMTITIRRNELTDEVRMPLLEQLQEHGVDVSMPPFNRQPAAYTNPENFVQSCLQEGFWGASRFIDTLLNSDPALRSKLIRLLGSADQYPGEAAAYLYALSCFEYQEVAAMAVETLGKLRHGTAITALNSLPQLTVAGLEEQIKRSLRRLQFLGINQPLSLPDSLTTPGQQVTIQATATDCYGLSTIWLSWQLVDETLAGLAILLSDQDGIRHTIASRFPTRADHDDYLEGIIAEEGLFETSIDYGLTLLREGIKRSITENYYLPPDFYSSRYLFGKADLRPDAYHPAFPADLLDGMHDRILSLLADSEDLLDEPFFEGWVLNDPMIYDLAEGCAEIPMNDWPIENLQQFVETVATELLEPERPNLLRRLLQVADFIQQLQYPERKVQRVLALSLGLAGQNMVLSSHPFIRRFVLESIEAARQSLLEGVDPRKDMQFDEDDDGDWV